jgi:LCP family protein required for cell wall assembly
MIRPVPNVDRPSGRPSPFAAAFLSLLFPGLGQVYAGRSARGLAFAAPPILGLALLGGLLASAATRDAVKVSVFDPFVLDVLLALDVLIFLYRLLAIVDAYRCAAVVVPEGPGRAARPRVPLAPFSLAGLAAVVLVMGMGHLALARYDRIAHDTIMAVTSDTPANPPAAASATASPGTSPAGSLQPAGQAAAAQPQPSIAPWNGGRLNVLLVGVDQRPDQQTFNTDTMIVASIDPSSGQVSMFSVPRDTEQVPLPPSWPAAAYFGGVFPNKINSLWTYAEGAPDLFPGTDATRGVTALKGALGYLLGIQIPYYAEVNFSGFRQVVDTLGGVTIDVQIPVTDYDYPTDNGRGAIKLYIPPGIQHMSGEEALAYARSRHATSDFDRSLRQQRVITSIRQQTDVLSFLDPNKLDALGQALRNAVHTDFPRDQLPQLVSLIEKADTSNLHSLVFTPPQYAVQCPPAECVVNYWLHPNVTAIRQAVTQAFSKSAAALAASRSALASENAQILVENGSGINGQATAVAAYLSYLGMNATVPSTNNGRAPHSGYTQTVVTFYNGAQATMPETVQVLQSILGVTVQTATDPAVKADVIVITGTATPQLTVPGG